MWIEINDKLIVGIHTDEIQGVNDNKIIYIEGSSFSDLGKWYTKAKGIHDPVLSKAQLNEEKKAEEIYNAKRYLKQTDYVVTKISEAIVSGDDELKIRLLEQYADVLQKRKESRELVG